MSSSSKLNVEQKEIMAHFMSEHPDLAKNSIPNSVEGKFTTVRLWEELTKQLNEAGPPFKSSKSWRKTFADQKYIAKKKLAFNKASKTQTGGGHFQEKVLTPLEELLVDAAGLEECVDEKPVLTFVNVTEFSPAASSRASECESNQSYSDLPSTSASAGLQHPTVATNKTQKFEKLRNKSKSTLLKENIKMTADHQQLMRSKFDKLLEINEKQLQISGRQLDIQERQLEINERELQMKEEEHQLQRESKDIDLKIKQLELEALQRKYNELIKRARK